MTNSVSTGFNVAKMEKKRVVVIDSFSSLPTDETRSRYNHSAGFVNRVMDSFKRDPSAHTTASNAMDESSTFDVEKAALTRMESPLARKLKGRNLQMIAIGGSIGALGETHKQLAYKLMIETGTGLFVGSGSALAKGGPASLVIAFSMVGLMLYCTVHALGELAVLFPIAGSSAVYSTRFIDPAWGFAMGWNYALLWVVVLPLEIVSATLTIEFWDHGRIDHDAIVPIFFVLIVLINFFGVKGYGEAEFVFSIIKVTAIVGFIILGIILNIGGGGPEGEYIGGRYWREPGAFHHGFKGFCSVFVTAVSAFTGTELVGLAAAETISPRKSLPTAIKQVFWRITLFYVVSVTLIGLLVPYNDPRLLGGKYGTDATASPFVIAIQNAGIEGLPSIMNVVIMITVLSVGNSSIYASSRTLAALAGQGQAPRILGYIDRKGRPIVSIGAASIFGLLAFLASSSQETNVFNWLLAISSLSCVFTWSSVCLAHIRFRKAWRVQGHNLDELAFRSQPGILGSWVGLTINCFVLIAQFWTGAWPIDYKNMATKERAISFFQAYLAVPIVLAFYVSYKVAHRTTFVRSKDMDLHSGILESNLSRLIAEEKAERGTWSRWQKAYKFFC
jgi:amino acid transporter